MIYMILQGVFTSRKYIKQIQDELQEKHSKDKSTYLDGALVLLALAPLLLETMSSFVYFYSNYILYSILGILFGCLFAYAIPKFFIQIKTFWYYFFIITIIISWSVWYIPKFIHIFYSTKIPICFDAKLTYKIYFPRDESAKINFELISLVNAPRDLKKLHSVHGIPYDEYTSLPPIGSRIKICGKISKVGFGYEYIETKAGNFSNEKLQDN
jgi:hypothetical protein